MIDRTLIPSLNLTAAQAIRTLGLASDFAGQIGAGLTSLGSSRLQLLKSVLGQLDVSRLLGNGAGTVPHFPAHRSCCSKSATGSYFQPGRLGRRTSAKEIAEIQDLNIGLPRKINDTMEKKAAAKMIAASYRRPVRLDNGKWLSRGMIYDSYRDVVADRADGRQDGFGVPAFGLQGRRPLIHDFLTQRPASGLEGLVGGFRPDPGWTDVRPTPSFPIFPPAQPGGGSFPVDPGFGVPGGSSPTLPGPAGPITGGNVNDRLVSAFGPAIGKADSDIQSLMQKVQANPDDQMSRFQLQQAMQRRTELITLLTNLMKSEHDARMAIARNLRV